LLAGILWTASCSAISAWGGPRGHAACSRRRFSPVRSMFFALIIKAFNNPLFQNTSSIFPRGFRTT
jgi:hypothetical protein